MTVNRLQQFNNLRRELQETKQLANSCEEQAQKAIAKLIDVIIKQNKLICDLMK